MSKITLKTLSDSIDQLAVSMLKFSEAVENRFNVIDGRFDQVDERFDLVDKRFDRIDVDFEDVKMRFDNKADRFELKELDKRVTKIETNIGLESK